MLGVIPVEHFEWVGFGSSHSIPRLIIVLGRGSGGYCIGLGLSLVIYAAMGVCLEEILLLGLETFGQRLLRRNVGVRRGTFDAGRGCRVAGYTDGLVKACFRVRATGPRLSKTRSRK
jgi:hypothetical protein